MSDWPDEVERVASLWKRDCHEAVHGFNPLTGNWNIHVSDADNALPDLIYKRMMNFATPSAGKNELFEAGTDLTSGNIVNPRSGALGVLSRINEDLHGSDRSLEMAQAVTDDWAGAGADGFVEYLIKLRQANKQAADYMDSLAVLIRTHGVLITGMKQGLFDLQKEILQRLDGGGSMIPVGAIAVSALKTIATKGHGVLDAIGSAFETALEKGIEAAVDQIGSDDDYLQPYYELAEGLLVFRGAVDDAVSALRTGYDELASAMLSKRHLVEPTRPALVTAAAFDPADFMLPEYLEPTIPAHDGQPAEYEIRSEYKDKIEPKVPTDDVAAEEPEVRGAEW